MSDGLTKLQNIGAQKIHERTHIARQHVQAVLHETFDDMTKIQLLGFVSILEREYGVDLTYLKEKAKEFYAKDADIEDEHKKVFIAPKKKKSYTLLYILLVLVIFGVGVFFTLDTSAESSQKTDTHAIDNRAINNAKESISQNAIIEEDENATITEVVVPEPEVVPEVVEVVKSFKIIPSSELWIGYIDLSNHKKYQKLFKDELEIDPNKDWILTLGHGYVKIEINGEITEFNDKLNIRLLYKDAKLSKITFQEFKDLNRGNKW
nr:hypothetical protein [uncultured Sulfurimonas sp.]